MSTTLYDPSHAQSVVTHYHLQYEVQYILDSVVDSLAANPNRKFIEVEMYGTVFRG